MASTRWSCKVDANKKLTIVPYSKAYATDLKKAAGLLREAAALTDNATLKKWATRCREWQRKGKDVYVYFDNDQEGYAAFNAKTLGGMLG